jgi:hypothetical protein
VDIPIRLGGLWQLQFFFFKKKFLHNIIFYIMTVNNEFFTPWPRWLDDLAFYSTNFVFLYLFIYVDLDLHAKNHNPTLACEVTN